MSCNSKSTEVKIENGKKITKTTVTVDGKTTVTTIEEDYNGGCGGGGFDDDFADFKKLQLGGGGGHHNSSSPAVEDKPLDLKAFRTKVLDEANKYRKLHKVKPLKLDDKLNKHAQEWAEHLASTGKFQHRSNDDYGENLFMGTGGLYQEVVKHWYDEVNKYDFKNPRFVSGTGHFSQLVWKGSERLGVGAARSKTGATIVCANFDPAGNVSGQFAQNVFPK